MLFWPYFSDLDKVQFSPITFDFLKYTPNWPETFSFMQFCLCQISISALNFSAFFIVVLGFEFL
jgi:hypothetical protein